MEKKKIYVIFTYTIIPVGGTQMYTAGKTKYLENLGWKVFVFFAGSTEGTSAIPSLTKYIKQGGGLNFLATPPYKFKRYEQERFLLLMLQRLNISNPNEYEIIFESHEDKLSYWAELLAAKIGAQHFFVACNEVYRPTMPDKTYGDNLDFYYFKWKRNELVAGEITLQKLFNGYKNVTAPLIEIPNTVREMDAVQDVDFPIEQLPKLDWNICHIGRAVKDYVEYVIKGVGELAKRYPNKRIHFIMVGNADSRMELMKQTFQNLPNVAVTLLGDLVPIPRNLFSKVDVVCAISQSARFAANEGVLTICANAENPEKTPGVLGYDTEEQVHGEGIFSYVEVLENVLVKKLYDGKEYSLPKLEPAEKYYEKFWTIVKNADPKKEYFVQRLTKERIRTWTAIFPFGMIARGARIILFGATEIAKDYRKQIESQNNSPVEFGSDYVKQLNPKPYCQIVATVDEHPEEFDNEIVGVERLLKKDYDVIIITTFPQNAQSAYNAIVKTVPEMTNRVVYKFQSVPT